ncbi:RNA 2',3'-cyclic phosphodiesterase [Methylobacterium sp. WCS2018Hpa-22]|uniref:RNA 2',3'-cyclic phosphodiesterase n=1 Tax=Methylobacterium sp. WCS2018Hpa-22 TaxID=3073633 RepID=UPI00288BE92D|nr:RNA 2',3'-cyclic phosphodiesterase [Methylobacterium sp. WCS2018Hpa-22]
MPRLFTAIEIPDDAAEALTRYQCGLRGARWIERGDLHITLRFLGDVDDEVAEAFHAGLVEARPRPPLNVTLSSLDAFGGDKPRAIIASVTAGPDLLDLQDEHERIARAAGAEPARRKFTPHVTLARLNRRDTQAADVAGYIAEAGLFATLRFTATRVALFSARESRGGGPYVVEAAYPLG